ncbi:MAG TPA: hypothetical protein VLM38_18770 [Blastocatellia bacterium]|nr:hypothetical protein [Blastocatellia bacterium]
MRTGRIKRAPDAAGDRMSRGSQAAFDPLTAEPNVLRDRVCKALSLLAEDERSGVRDRILVDLTRAGLNIGQCLLLLGIPARTADELTAPEMATLIRYVRINEPKAMTALVPVLSEMLTLHPAQSRGLRVSRAA